MTCNTAQKIPVKPLFTNVRPAHSDVVIGSMFIKTANPSKHCYLKQHPSTLPWSSLLFSCSSLLLGQPHLYRQKSWSARYSITAKHRPIGTIRTVHPLKLHWLINCLIWKNCSVVVNSAPARPKYQHHRPQHQQRTRLSQDRVNCTSESAKIIAPE